MSANKRRAAAAAQQKAKVLSSPRPRPTEKEIANYVRLSKVFKKAQYSKTSHPQLLEKIMAIYSEMRLNEFLAAFQTCLRVPFLRPEKDSAVLRTLEFAAEFCTGLNAAEDEAGEGDLCPFVHKMFKYLLENSPADLTPIRFRICQLVNLIFSGLGEGVALEEDMAEAITEAMLKRVRDKAPATRAQAVQALERLQDPGDPHCKVMKAFKFHMEHDPSPQVRAQAMRSIAKNQSTITCLYARHTDSSEHVRHCCVLVMAKIHVRSLRISYRSSVLFMWLKDPAASVRHQAETVLLPAWFNCVGKDYVTLLRCLDLDTEGGVRTCQLVIDTLFKSETAESLAAVLTPLQTNKTILLTPDEATCAAKAFLWRCVVRHLREAGDEEQLDAVLPELTPFCSYLRLTLLGVVWEAGEDQVDHTDLTFVLLQLVDIAGGYDFADEMGRTSLYTLVLDLISSLSVENRAVHELVKVVAALDPDVDSRLLRLAELVSDIHAPLYTASQAQPITEGEFKEYTLMRARLRIKAMEVGANQEEAIACGDFLLAQAMEEELVALREELAGVDDKLSTIDKEGVRKETSEPEELVRCLHVVAEMMRSSDVSVLTPHLRSLMQDFVSRIYEAVNHVEVRTLCLKCYACFCLLDVELAQEKMPMFYLQLADGEENSPVGVMALTAIFDLYFYYGLQMFNVTDDIDLHYNNIVGKKKDAAPETIAVPDSSDTDHSSESTAAPNAYKYSVLHTLYNIFDDLECPLLHPPAALGFCKLLLSGRINSYRLLSRLLLFWYRPDLDKPCQQTLTSFFRGYTCNRKEGLGLMVQALIPTAEAIVDAPHNSPLATIKVDNVVALIANLTRPGYNPNVEQNYHNDMAVVILNRIVADPESELVVPLTLALTSLKVTHDTDPQLQALLGLAERVTKKVTYDKMAVKNATKFYLTLRHLMLDNEEDSDASVASVSSRATDQSVATVSEANTTRRTEQLETIVEDSPPSTPSRSSPSDPRNNRPTVPMVVSESDCSSD